MAIFEFIKDVLQATLYGIHDHLHVTWAWSIVLLTVAVRIILLPLGVRQTRSMVAMQRLQPYVKQLQQRFKNDRQELNVKMMEFYRDNNVNPLASCLPLVLQLPVFYALYWVLRSFEKHASHPHHGDKNFGFLWGFIHNITLNMDKAGWHALVLLALYVASQMLSTLLMSAAPQAAGQRGMMLVLPLVMAPFIYRFQVGLVIYWLTTNLWTIGQTRILMRIMSSRVGEVVLPADAKGNKKVIVPKGEKAKAAAKADTAAPTQPNAPGRRNKRRR